MCRPACTSAIPITTSSSSPSTTGEHSRDHDLTEEEIDLLSLEAAQKEFEAAGVYVNTASIGLPPRRAVEALNDAIETWRTGRAEAAGYDELVHRARQQFASLVATTLDRVAIGNQVSTFTALVASALPDGARVLAAEEDFTSLLFPFLAHADRGVHVRTVPLAGLVEAIGPSLDPRPLTDHRRATCYRTASWKAERLGSAATRI